MKNLVLDLYKSCIDDRFSGGNIMSNIDKVCDFIVEQLLFGQKDKLNDDTSFFSTGLFDSLGMLEVIKFLEETFNITVEDDELVPENFENLNCIAQFIERKLNGNR